MKATISSKDLGGKGAFGVKGWQGKAHTLMRIAKGYNRMRSKAPAYRASHAT
jgi:hypothetical protein